MSPQLRAASPWRRIRSALSVALVFALAGLLFTANARLARGDDVRHPEDLAGLLRKESERVNELTEQVDELSAKNDALSKAGTLGTPAAPDPALDIAVGTVAVRGPGISVALDDAPTYTGRDNVSAFDLVVHQQDLQAVINALWAGGAEAMTLQGERVTTTSAFRCAGNILLLHGRVFSPPYVVQAVGDQERMRASLQTSDQIAVYKEYVKAYGLGWKVEDHATITLPAYKGALELKYATVPTGESRSTGAQQ